MFAGQTAFDLFSGNVNAEHSLVALQNCADSCLNRAESAQSPDSPGRLSTYLPNCSKTGRRWQAQESASIVRLYTVIKYIIFFLSIFKDFLYCTEDLMTVTCVSWFPPHLLHHFWLLFLSAPAGLLPAKKKQKQKTHTIGISWHQRL